MYIWQDNNDKLIILLANLGTVAYTQQQPMLLCSIGR